LLIVQIADLMVRSLNYDISVVSVSIYMKFFVQVMVRTYVRKMTRGAGGNWSHENLLLAIEAVHSKTLSRNQVAVNFGIPEPTLRRLPAQISRSVSCQQWSVSSSIFSKHGEGSC